MAERINWRVLRDADSIRIDIFDGTRQRGIDMAADLSPKDIEAARATMLARMADPVAVDEAFAEAFA